MNEYFVCYTGCKITTFLANNDRLARTKSIQKRFFWLKNPKKTTAATFLQPAVCKIPVYPTLPHHTATQLEAVGNEINTNFTCFFCVRVMRIIQQSTILSTQIFN